MIKKITLYKKKLYAEEEGLVVQTDKFVSIHETPCFYFCVEDRFVSLVSNALKHTSETPVQAARRLKYLKRISKKNSRFASPTEAEALEHLKFIKGRQLGHMKRETDFINAFLECEELTPATERLPCMVPDSKELVRKYLNFDF